MITTVNPFMFKIVHPVMYAQHVGVQAADYATAAGYMQAHIAGTDWKVALATDMTTGLAVSNG